MESSDRARTKLTPLQDIPYAGSSHFVGREEQLEQLHQALQHSERVVISAIAGMGGVGKTELATQYARRNRSSYPGGVCWLRAREGSLEAQLLQKVELELGLQVPQKWRDRPLTLPEQVEWCWQNWQPDGTVLVILDDVAELADVQAVLPTIDRFRVVLTTRQRGLDASFVELALDVLPLGEAIELLQKLIGAVRVERELETAAQLCEQLGYLPLGLELVGRYVGRDRSLSLAEMLTRLEAQRLQDESLERNPQYQMTAQRSVKAAFELTWKTLDDSTQAVAMLLSLFTPEEIAWSLVEQMMQQVQGAEFSCREARRDLDNSHLIQPVATEEEVSPTAYKLHPLIREFLQAKLAEFSQPEPLRQAFARVLVDRARQLPETLTLDGIAAFAIVRPHLEAVARDMRDCLSDNDLIWALWGVAKFHQEQGLYTLAEPWYQECLAVTQEQFGNDHPAVASSLHTLGVLYKDQGRYEEAEPLYLRALELRKRLLGNDHPHVASILNSLALLYSYQRRYEEAESLCLQALELRKRLLGNDHPDVASSLHCLATLYNAQRRYKEAEPLFLQSLELNKRLLGNDHPQIATSLHHLALLYNHQGRYEAVQPLYVQSLELRKRLLGNDHPHVATSLNNLAALYKDRGRYEAAESLYLQALSIYEQRLGTNHPYTGICKRSLERLRQQMDHQMDHPPMP